MEIKDVVPGVFISAGKAILWNAVVVTGGFLTLVLSQMPPNQKLGLICSLGIITSLISSFLVVPVLFVRGKHTHVLKYVDNKNNLL
jgi:predicted RND superfamily exporter protein